MTRQFISLKWKAFIYTSLLLVAVFGLFMLASGFYAGEVQQEQRRERTGQNVDLVDALLVRAAQRLQIHVDAFPSYEGVGEALALLDADALRIHAAAFWQQVSKHESVTSMVIFSPSDDVILSRGEPRVPPELLEKFRTDWKPRWSLACFDRCELYWVAPVHFVGDLRGMLVLGSDLVNLVQRFAEFSPARLAIVVRRDEFMPAQHSSLAAWGSEIVAADDKVSALLQTAAKGASRTDVFNGIALEYAGKQFDIALRPLKGAVFPRQGELLFVTDISNKVREYQIGRRNNVIFALAGLVLAELILISTLWGPLNRLRAIAEVLPRLATENFAQIRALLDGFKRTGPVRDESDMLAGAALHLSHLLEDLQREVRARADELEKKTVDLEAEKLFVHSLLDTAHALILTQDRNGCIALTNQHCHWITGFEPGELLGKSFFKLLPESEQLPDLRFHLGELLNGFRNELHHESSVVRKDGSTLHMAWHHSLLPQTKEEHQILSIALDISERKEAEERLGWLASHDSLTGLYNRRRFGEELEKAVTYAKRYERSGAVLFFDLDQFKDVNDTSGHKVGDELLHRVAECLRHEARESDLIFRLGGDEFSMIAREVTRESIAALAKRLCHALSRIEVQGVNRLHRVSSSIGIALFPEHGEHAEELVANADIAMYQVKDAGRNGWHIYSDEDQNRERIHERVYWNEKVKEALSTDSMMVVFQAIQKIGEEKPSHFEALMRVMDENGKPLPVNKFIQSAENSGLIQEVDLRIMTKVMEAKKKLEQRGIAATLSINLSGVSFHNPDLYAEIAFRFAHYQINPAEIIFEITETSAVADPAATSSMMKELKQLGCQFALDDFGVGFSSLYQIKLLPIDMVKIDGSFIRHLPQQDGDQALVRAIVEVARVFGLKTVAEFVENEAIVEKLRELGVDYAQGYHIAEPRSFEKIWGGVADSV